MFDMTFVFRNKMCLCVSKKKESYQLVSFIKLKTANINIYSAYLVCFILH